MKPPQSVNYYLNPLSHDTDFSDPGQKGLMKTLWEKKKMLVTSISYFSHNVFYYIKDNFHQLGYTETVICKCFHFRQS